MLFSFSTATLLASATTVVGVAIKRDICNANLDPIQIRLAYAGEGGMAISWNTLQQMNNPTDEQPNSQLWS
jgi:acid phosphatase type 7